MLDGLVLAVIFTKSKIGRRKQRIEYLVQNQIHALANDFFWAASKPQEN